MKVYNQFPLARILIFFITGILLSTVIHWNCNSLLMASIGIISIQIIWYWVFPRKVSYRFRSVSGFVMAASFILLGIYSARNHQPTLLPKSSSKQAYLCVVKQPAKQTNEKQKLICNALNLQYIAKYDIQLTIPLDTTKNLLIPGDRFLFYGYVNTPDFTVNPGGFDYNKYLSRQHISGLGYAKADQVLALPTSTKYSVLRYSTLARNLLLDVLLAYAPSKNLYGIVSAIILGYDDDLSPDSRKGFSSAGAMHILCVSGLHVGVIYLILNVLFTRLFKKKSLRFIRFILILLGLWCYAFITGLSPSVLRASVMFSFVLIGKEMNRNVSIYNTIAASALLLLFVKPFLLFAVGFQLSYLAVIAIVTLYNPISLLFSPGSKITKHIYDIMAVSIAAQAGTFPLAIYYFHTFPTGFLITNLVVIPMASLILYSGIGSLVLSPVPLLSRICAWILYFLTNILNKFISFVSSVPGATLEAIWIDEWQVVILYLLLIVLGFLLINGFRNNTSLLWMFLLLLITTIAVHNNLLQRQNRMVVYGAGNNLYVDFIQGRTVFQLQGRESKPVNEKTVAYMLKPARDKFGVSMQIKQSQKNTSVLEFIDGRITFLSFAGKRIVICEGTIPDLDSLAFPPCDIAIIHSITSSELKNRIYERTTDCMVTLSGYYDDQEEIDNINADVSIHDITHDGAFHWRKYNHLGLLHRKFTNTGR